MSLAHALDLIHRFLLDLEDTGASGFEGLIAALCDAATGQRFRISGSGPQEGQDIRSEPGIGNLIKVEAKHYAKGKLSLRELEGELAQAALAGSGMDLWVLAASCRVNDEHAKKLEADASQFAIEVLFLDMGNEGLPRLAVLMAAFPQVVESWVNLHSSAVSIAPLRAALDAVRGNFQFARVEALMAAWTTPALDWFGRDFMLASFSNISMTAFEELVARANITDTWVERAVKTMRENVQANELAQDWYRAYLNEPDPDKAWGAYQMMLKCGDARFYTWCRRIESETKVDVDQKRRFVSANWQSTQRALNRESKRKDHLFGQPISRGQIFPFVSF